LTELDFAPNYPMRLYCDNPAVVHIAENLIFHKHTKHIEVIYYLVCQKREEKIIQAQHVSSSHQLTDLTKSLEKTQVDFICENLSMYDVTLRENVRKHDF